MQYEEPTGSNEWPASDADLLRAQRLALKYRCEFVDLRNFQPPPIVLKRIPRELMFRYNFVQLRLRATGESQL